MKEYKAGIDIGSTTIKLAVLDEKNTLVFHAYQRHYAHIQKTLLSLLEQARKQLGNLTVKVQMTGSGALSLSKSISAGFVQEVVAVAYALKEQAPQCDAAIELGGEDAKIIYFNGTLEERMNGVCAGGTGSFIDQMASLLSLDAAQLNEKARHYKQIYPIAARCGVFAKSDIQPLINDGAAVEDLAASIFQAVVNQTISSLACGKPIRGNVAFLGGPLHYLDQLRAAFVRTLKLTEEQALSLENTHLFAAIGAAGLAEQETAISLDSLIARLKKGVHIGFELKRLEPLFQNTEEYEAFVQRHSRATVEKAALAACTGPCFLGIDAGSTTAKMALISREGKLLYSFYAPNQSNPVAACRKALLDLYEQLPPDAWIARSCSTGYGETLLQSAFALDEGEVETIAHTAAAKFFDPQCDCVLDIGGQDMKCIQMKDGMVDTILLNEACSSGCGSFIENFASSLGYTAEEFSKLALFASSPLDLGTRCTVFMNSNVKQAQKEGACIEDISAGLAYSVIKNALYKVIKLSEGRSLGQHAVVQGGTFYNHAVLRAFEKISGMDAVCPDISGIMGAFGSALTARKHYTGQKSTTIGQDALKQLQWSSVSSRCQGCSNHCLLTISSFDGKRRHISGNRCERPLGNASAAKDVPNVYEWKKNRMFAYTPAVNAPRGKIGIPRVLNLYEHFPFWAVFFEKLGFEVVLSPESTQEIYEKGMDSIPSETECFPAKLAHGHVQWLIEQKVPVIFYPCVFYERKENLQAQNHFSCPMVISSPENIKNNQEGILNGSVRFLRPFLAFTDEKTLTKRLCQFCAREWGIDKKSTAAAAAAGWKELLRIKYEVKEQGRKALAWMEENHRPGIVLVGRPYHADGLVNHGIVQMIASYQMAVLSEDSLPAMEEPLQLRVNDQWTYHSRLYRAAAFACTRDDLELVQLNSFGCGLDAVTTDQVMEILNAHHKLYTVLKIDEVSNLGAARIRIRSLIAAMELRKERNITSVPAILPEPRAVFTKEMFQKGYTILAPQMSPIHMSLLEPVFQDFGFHVKVLDNDNQTAIEAGLKYVNNDACFPSITVIGQIMDAMTSGNYDPDRTAIIMTQTGGCCRASNYIALIRRALKTAGLEQVPVISLNCNGMEKNEGFQIPARMWVKIGQALIYSDLLMRVLYRTRPYEKEPNAASRLYETLKQECIHQLHSSCSPAAYARMCRRIVEQFDALEIYEGKRLPKVGIVGEILVKYMPLANNHLVELLEKEGVEAVVPDLLDFLNYCLKNLEYKEQYLGAPWYYGMLSSLSISALQMLRQPAAAALKSSRRFGTTCSIHEIAEKTKPFLSLGNQYGEGWFLTGEMVELIESGTPNIICIQPFGCLPNHAVGKGTIKRVKQAYPHANIVAVDYDPGASQVNQLNRIKLMLSSALGSMTNRQEDPDLKSEKKKRESLKLKFARS